MTTKSLAYNIDIMRTVKKTNQLKTNVIAARCNAKFKQDVVRKCNQTGLSSESEAVIGLLKAWLTGEVEYKDYRFVAKQTDA